MPRRHSLPTWSRYLAIYSLLSLFAIASAATTVSSQNSPSSTGSSPATTHTVFVGNSGNAYDPNTTYASPGDVVSFQFYPTNHSVVRGEYSGSEACGAAGCNPCVPYSLIHPGAPGMFYSQNFLEQTYPTPANLGVRTKASC
jgi:plastocyanin